MKTSSNATKRINNYLVKLPLWSRVICITLRQIAQEEIEGVTETWKWGPTFNNKFEAKVMSIWALKRHVTLTLWQGAQVNDQHKLFTNGLASTTSRVIQYKNITDVHRNEQHLREYIRFLSTISELKPIKKPRTAINIPVIFKRALQEKNIYNKFKKLDVAKQLEYINIIKKAKTKETKIIKISMSLPKIALGKGCFIP